MLLIRVNYAQTNNDDDDDDDDDENLLRSALSDVRGEMYGGTKLLMNQSEGKEVLLVAVRDGPRGSRTKLQNRIFFVLCT